MGYIARVLGVLIVFLSTFMFVNIDNVKAGTIQGGPGYGYAQCSYRATMVTGSAGTSSGGAESWETLKLVVKVWGSKSDGKNWLNWTNVFYRGDNVNTNIQGRDQSVTDIEVQNEHTGLSDGATATNDSISVIDALYSENYNTAMGEYSGNYSCPAYACYKKEGNNYKWQFPSRKQQSNNECPSGYEKKIGPSTIEGETKTSNTEKTDGTIDVSKISEEEWAGIYDDDLESYKDQIKAWGDRSSYDNQYNDVGDPCKTISNNPWLIQLLSWLFWFIAIAGLVIFLVMSIMDFIKAVTGSDDANLKKAFKNLAIRAVVVVILFLLPALLNLIINFLNENLGKEGTYQIGSDGNLYCDVISSD